jgi:hypothetical protein
MLHEDDYKVILTDEKIPVFLVKSREGEPENPVLLYDGGRHATFYRQSNQTVLFDYLNDKVVEQLQTAEKIMVFELSDEIEDVARDYEVRICRVRKNAWTDGLE